MPCYSVGGGKYQLGHNGSVYKDKSACERAYRAYLAKKYKGHHSAPDGRFLERRKRKFGIKE